MRRTYILFLFISIVMGMSSFANASVTVPEVGKVYHLVHNRTGYYLTTNISAQGASISPASGEINQRFHIIPQGGGVYQIQEVESQLYWYKRDNWDTGWTSSPAEIGDRALFELPVKGENVFIECHFKHEYGNFFGTGTDNNSTWISSDRNDQEVNSQWRIVEYNPDFVEKTALQNKMVEIKNFMRTVTFGDAARQYSLELKGKIEDKIRDAQAIVASDDATQEQVDACLHELSDLFTTLQVTRNPFDFDSESQYYIIHSSGFYLTASEDHYASLAVGDGNENQRFKVEVVKNEDGTYYYTIKHGVSGKYWYRRDRWDTGWTLEPENLRGDVNGVSVAQPERARFNIYGTGNTQYSDYVLLETQFRFVEDGGPLCMGAGSGTEGEWLSSDKSGNVVNSYWKIVKYNTEVAIKEGLYEAIQAATAFLGNQNVKLGNNPGEYTPEIYNALKAKLEEANGVYENSTSQEEVNKVQKELEDALALCRYSINVIQPVEGGYYGITFEQDYTMIDKDAVVSLGYDEENSIFKFKPVTVEGVVYYQIQNNVTGKYMYLGGLTELKWISNVDMVAENALFAIESAGDLDHPLNVVLKVKANDMYIGNDMSGEGDKWKEVTADKEKAEAMPWSIVARTPVGIASTEVDNTNAPQIYALGGKVQVNNLRGVNRISVYSLSGALILSEECSAAEYSTSLPFGVYVVSVKGEVGKTEKVAIK